MSSLLKRAKSHFDVPSKCSVSFQVIIPKRGQLMGVALIVAKIIDTLDLYSPALKGLQEVHAFACESLENLVFDQHIAGKHAATAAYLYGRFTE